jgi:hypothetical protein
MSEESADTERVNNIIILQCTIQFVSSGSSISIAGNYNRCSGACVFIIITKGFPDLL